MLVVTQMATPAPIGSANNDKTCEDCVYADNRGFWTCSLANRLHKNLDEFSRYNPIDLRWAACAKFESSSKYVILKIYLEENFNRITNSGDMWMNEDFTVIFSGDKIMVKYTHPQFDQKANLGSFYDETEVIALLRSSTQSKPDPQEMARLTIQHLHKGIASFQNHNQGGLIETNQDHYTDVLSQPKLIDQLTGNAGAETNSYINFLRTLPKARELGATFAGGIHTDPESGHSSLYDPWGRHYGIRFSGSEPLTNLRKTPPETPSGYPRLDWETIEIQRTEPERMIWTWGSPEDGVAPIII